MKVVSNVCLAAAVCLWAKVSMAELTAEQTQQVKAFVAGVHALDPHTEKSEPAFQALVEQYVPDTGPLQTFLDFMIASGFECPWPSWKALDPKKPTYPCAFEPDLGATAEPNLAGITEVSWFHIAAHYDEHRNLTKLEPTMTHGFIGP